MPAWLYTLGRVFTQKTNIDIPFTGLIFNLLLTIVPCLFGLFLSKCFPKLKIKLMKIVKPALITLLLIFLVLMVYVKYYIFTLIRWKQWLTAPFLPWSGFIIGAFIALITKRPLQQVITIALETGVQNAGIAFLVIIYNFPTPESDYAILPLISVSLLTSIPLWLFLLFLTIKRKIELWWKRNDEYASEKNDVNMEALLESEKINYELKAITRLDIE